MLDSFFKISQRGSTVGREIRGGVVTFFTMAYIVALNPLIIGLAKDADGKYIGGGDAPNLALVAAATALIAGVMTILMGVVANFPLAIATGLGLNTFVAVGIASKMSWADAMGLVVLEGIIILILVLTGFRIAVFKAVPSQLKIAISVGIGLFIALIGLVDAGFVRRTGTGPVPVTLGDNGNLVGWPVVVFAFGLFLMIGLTVKKVKGALLIGIVTSTALAIAVESAFKIGPLFNGATGAVNPKGWNLNVPAMPEAIAAAAGGAGSVSSNTSYIESASGVGEGAKTGLASVVTGVLFLLTTFLAPLVAIIPYEAATPALVIVGFLMMTQIKGIDWDDLGIAIPAFLTIILMPFTYNISVGIGAGFVSYVVIRLFQGRSKEISPLLWIVAGLFMVYFLQSPINIWTA